MMQKNQRNCEMTEEKSENEFSWRPAVSGSAFVVEGAVAGLATGKFVRPLALVNEPMADGDEQSVSVQLRLPTSQLRRLLEYIESRPWQPPSTAEPEIRTVRLDRCDGEICVTYTPRGGGGIVSALKADGDPEAWQAAVDGIEGAVLAAACAGFDVADPTFQDGVQAALGAAAAKYGEESRDASET